MKISAINKKWISVIAMIIIASTQITKPIDLKSYIPAIAYQVTPLFGLTVINIIAFVLLICAYWIAKSETA